MSWTGIFGSGNPKGAFSDDEISIGEFARQTNRDVGALAGIIGHKMP